MTSSTSHTIPATANPSKQAAPATWWRDVHVISVFIFWLAGLAVAVPQFLAYGDALLSVWKLPYNRPLLSITALALCTMAMAAAVIAVSIIAYRVPDVIAGWILRNRTVRLQPPWWPYVRVISPGAAAALLLYGIIPIIPLLGKAALFVGWWVPALAAAGLIAVGLYFILEWRARSISQKGFPHPSPDAIKRLKRINPRDEPLSRMDDTGTPVLWYLTGCTPVARDEGDIVWAYFGDIDPSVINVISHCTASYPRFVTVPDDLEQRDAVAEAARRYDLWPRFKDPDFAYQPGNQAGFGVRLQGNPPLPGVPERRILVVGLRVFHSMRSVRYVKPDAVFGTHSENADFQGIARAATDGTLMEVHTRQGKPPKPPMVFGIVQFRQEGLRHASGYRTFFELPGPDEYTGVAIDGVDGSGALLLRIGNQVHRVPPGITSPKRYDWSGYLLYRGAQCEETVRCWVQGFFLLPEELVRWKLDLPDEPAESAKGFLPLQEFFKFPAFVELR